MRMRLILLLVASFLTSGVLFSQTNVPPGDGTLSNAIKSASDGDVLVLSDGGLYTESNDTTFWIDKKITIEAASGATIMPKIQMHEYAAGTSKNGDMFTLTGNGALALESVELDGGIADTSQYEAVASLVAFDLASSNYSVAFVKLINCKAGACNGKIVDGANSSASGITLDTLEVSNTIMYNASNGLNFKTVGLGYSDVENSTFENIRSGYGIRVQATDPSVANVIHCTFDNFGPSDAFIQVKKTNDVTPWVVKDCIFSNLDSGTKHGVILTGSSSLLSYCDFWNAADFDNLDGAAISDTMNEDPAYKDEVNGDLTLLANSPLLKAGDDGTALGDPRWAPTATAVNNTSEDLPGSYSLKQNYPNPFNPSTVISFSLKQAGMVNLDVYNTLGEKVSSLVNEYLNAGDHSVTFNAANLSSGVYFYRLRVNNNVDQKKMLLLK